jgi:hypothetical protein
MKDTEAHITATVAVANDSDASSDEKRFEGDNDQQLTSDAALVRDWTEEEETKVRRKYDAVGHATLKCTLTVHIESTSPSCLYSCLACLPFNWTKATLPTQQRRHLQKTSVSRLIRSATATNSCKLVS